MPVDENNPRSAYLQIADQLREAIKSGELAPGQRLQSGRDLAKLHDVAPMTIQQAIRVLRDEGLIVTWQGRGAFVRSGTDSQEVTAVEQIIDQLRAVREDLERLENRVSALESTRAHGQDRRRGG